jgi:NADPH-dependent 2,4-dienoyl-CoA reductase/sulfur reductase-like enzyme
MTNPDSEFEVVVVGAGPAGLAAACTAAESHRRVALVDETPWIGGQIWRGQAARPTLSSARSWLARFHKSGVMLLDRTCVIGAPQPGLLLAEQDGQPRQIWWKRLIVATGARELFLPFPGWTLPGVMGPGGLLSLVKNGWPVDRQRVVIAGSGPLLLAAAKGLTRHGARVVSIAEQAPWKKVASFGFGLWRHPSKLWQGLSLKVSLRDVRFHYGDWPVRAEGTEQVRSVTLTDGHRTWSEDCDVLACGFGLIPNVELPLLLGCELENRFVQVDSWQGTSVPNVYCAGEPTGIGGADCALVEGAIAGYAAADQTSRAKALFGRRTSWHKFRSDLAQAFVLRPELKSLATEETLVCRCEDVTFARLRQFQSWREAKLHARCGMGPCQGRVCGAATKVIFGWGMESVRPPVSSARVSSLISED